MNPYSILTLCGVIFYVQIGLVSLRVRRERTNAIMAALAFCMALYAGYQTVLYSPSPRALVDAANTAFRLLGIASTSVCLLTIFTLSLGAASWSKTPRALAYALAIAAGAFFLVRGWFMENLIRGFGFRDGMWIEVITPLAPSGLAYIIFVYANFLFCLFVLARWLRRADSALERSQARLLLIASLITMAGHGAINYVLPFLSDRVLVPRITTICFMPLMFSIWFSIRKYRFLAGIGKSVSENPAWRMLTRREREIISYLRRGESFRRIGEILFISEGTVRKHVENMRAKLGVKNRVELIYKVFADEAVPARGDAGA